MNSPDPSRRRTFRLAAGLIAGAMMSSKSDHALAQPALLKRRIPRSGEEITAVGLGTWQSFDVGADREELAQAKESLRVFAELGGQVVDSSPMYGSAEHVVGDLAAELGLREKLFLATKVWTSGRASGLRQMEESFSKLKVGRLALMQVHNLVDASTHLQTLRDWKKSGRIRYLGVTHYHAGAHRDLEKSLSPGDIDFLQVNYSLAESEADRRLLRVAAEARVAVIVNRPFAEGAMFRQVSGRPLPDWAKDIDCASWAQFFLKWILGHPAVSCAIPGTRNPKHVRDNLGGAAGRLPDEAMRRRMAEHFARL